MATLSVSAVLNKAGQPPEDLMAAIQEFFPPDQHDAALAVSYLESAWDQWAVNDSALWQGGIGAAIGARGGVSITAELSVGYFQINVGAVPRSWAWPRLFIPRENVGTAHMKWASDGWRPWFFSASELGLL